MFSSSNEEVDYAPYFIWIDAGLSSCSSNQRELSLRGLAEWKSGRGRRDLRWGVDEEGVQVYQMGFQGSGGVGGATESDGGGDCGEGAGGDYRK
ncbi:hypothetical protein D8674_032543 [Pyrus ussuriensis x Pyrus communis]|uniref:Uncharacterized protein n=1 Tax=Pyrus ussuriensis x Pyrus communis TaxID=2448454 RepID=A0A5N5HJD0_9ROSA|nr:hypothetical protein D8674_032543 [Pyrus ussuriensis x Pyrus communis]